MSQKIKVAINGFGRIGRAAFKAAQNQKNLTIVAINDLAPATTLLHLLNYDSVYGRLDPALRLTGGKLVIGDNATVFLAEKEPVKLPWKALGVDVVLECTGRFRDLKNASEHLKAGAKKVIISAPGEGDIKTFVLGVNADSYKGEAVINNASCTTNCAAPVMSVLDKAFGIEKALLSTIHSYTADQALVDGPHQDLRRARSAALNIIPTSTGAAIAVTETIKNLTGKFDGVSFRVPTPVGSLCDITLLLKKKTNVKDINQAFVNAAKSKALKDILQATNEQLVSTDIVGNPHSAIVDLSLTQVIGGNLVKVIAWYDNEWAYSNRLIELASKIGNFRKKN